MKKSGFYIIKEQFFEDMNEPYLKGNKKENRPHYYCFEDENTGIYWMIPLSSKIEKYRKIMEKREAKGKTCDILHILRLDDKRESVFLIQDMFPITEQYIEREYKIANNHLMLTSEQLLMDQSRENIIEDSQDEIDIGELLRYLKTKWIVIVAVFLIGVIGAGVGTKCLITPKYTAVSKLYVVSASGKNIVNLDDLRLGTTLSSDYTELLKTRPICNEIISDLGLDYTVSQLKSMISIVPIEDTRLLTVSVVSADPEEAKNIANTLADKAVTYLPKLMGISAPNIAEEAITPAVPSSPSTKKNVALGGILALALIVGIYTVRFLMDDTVKTAEDVEKIIGVMPLTVILEYQDKDKKKQGRHRRK